MKQPPNVVWLTLDSVRYDHTSLSGYERNTTPNLERIAGRPDGHSFSQCISHAIWTQPSSGSILTGTYPSHHGLGWHNEVLPQSIDTAPELLSDVGYQTGCVSEITNVSSATGLDRGFDEFDLVIEDSKVQLALNHPFTVGRHVVENVRANPSGVLHQQPTRGATPRITNERIKSTVESFEEEERPYFLYAHYIGAHLPYLPPLRDQDRYLDGTSFSTADALELSRDVFGSLDRMRELIATGSLTDEQWTALTALYDAEIRYIDRVVGELFDYLCERDDVILIVTADHGEHLGERGLMAHKLTLDDELIHVPMVTYGTDELQADSGVVQHADVMQTILEIAGAETTQFQARNLIESDRTYAVSQQRVATLERFIKHDDSFDTTRFHDGIATSVRTSDFKYQESNSKSLLYNLPDENTDVLSNDPEKREELAAVLADRLNSFGTPVETSNSAELSQEMKNQLSDLGYI